MSEPILNHAPFEISGRQTLLLARDDFSTFGAKTAVCYLRYRGEDVVSVVDPKTAGRTVEDVLGFGGAVPVDATVEEALVRGADVAIVGVAPGGGRLGGELRGDILACVRAGLDVASGLHDFIATDDEIRALADQNGSRLWDVRWVPDYEAVGTGKGCATGAKTVLFVGTDCNVGKMTATVELHRAAIARGVRAGWAATGQTGILLRGRGVAVDRVVSDFIGAATEELINYEGRDRDVVFVEGQGSIVHPSFAAVTLGLLYGVMPDALILVHAASRHMIGDTPHELPPLSWFVSAYQNAMKPFKPCPVCAIVVNTTGLAERDARGTIERARADTGLPAADPIRGDTGAVTEALFETLSLA